jgi:hypothetical protein
MVVNLIALIVAMLLDFYVVIRIYFVIKKQLRVHRSVRRFVR